MSAIREICAICGHVSRIGFRVPDEVWKHAIHPSYQTSTVCLACFTERADEYLIAWDKDIEFFPVSFATHRGAIEAYGRAGCNGTCPSRTANSREENERKQRGLREILRRLIAGPIWEGRLALIRFIEELLTETDGE